MAGCYTKAGKKWIIFSSSDKVDSLLILLKLIRSLDDYGVVPLSETSSDLFIPINIRISSKDGIHVFCDFSIVRSFCGSQILFPCLYLELGIYLRFSHQIPIFLFLNHALIQPVEKKENLSQPSNYYSIAILYNVFDFVPKSECLENLNLSNFISWLP